MSLLEKTPTLPFADTLDGTEPIGVIQDGLPVQTTTQDIADLAVLGDTVDPTEITLAVLNETGGTLTAGTLVYVNDYDATTGKSNVAKADADGSSTYPATWVVPIDIADATAGTVRKGWTVSGLDTSGASAVGSLAYLSATAGGFTFTAPTGATATVQPVGTVTVKDATVGAIKFDLLSFLTRSWGTNNLQALAVTSAKLDTNIAVTGAFSAATVTAGAPTGAKTAVDIKQGANAAITGTTVTNGAILVTGVNTLFTTELAVGDGLSTSNAAGTYFRIQAITDDTHLTVETSGMGDGASRTFSRQPAALRAEDNTGTTRLSAVVGSSTWLLTSNLSLRSASAPTISGERVKGSLAAPTTIVADDVLLEMRGRGFDTAGMFTAGQIDIKGDGTWTTTSRPTYVAISTVPNASTTVTERFRVQSDGLLKTSAAYASGKTLQADASNILQPVNFPYCIPFPLCTVALPNARSAAPAAGTIVKFMVVVIVASTGAATCKLQIAGVDVTGSSVAIANTDAAGTVFTGTCTALNIIAAGDALTAVLSADASAVVSVYAYVG